VRADPALSGVEALVEVEKTDGTKLTVRCEHPRGSPENPLTRAQVEGKFRWYAKGVLAESHIEEVIAAVRELESLTSVERLTALLRRPGSEPLRR
jgi:2-methylcitrate dehydratase PrpD